MEYDIEMFGSRHPDFIGAIFVKDSEDTDKVMVASAQQFKKV